MSWSAIRSSAAAMREWWTRASGGPLDEILARLAGGVQRRPGVVEEQVRVRLRHGEPAREGERDEDVLVAGVGVGDRGDRTPTPSPPIRSTSPISLSPAAAA